MIVYLHGFRSSPQSFKARMLAERMALAGLAGSFVCPQLPVSPRDAIAAIRELHPLTPSVTLVGSSLGGFYATYLAERFGCRAVLLNPAIQPARDLAAYVGDLRTYHDDQPMVFRPQYLDELRDLEVLPLTHHERYLLIAAKGDELIDWRDMVARYRPARMHVHEGGDHALSDFDLYIDDVLRFAGHPAAARR
ncbi:MAG: YqiA/YcfP family alpha/beta fold hydrolase [Burkholderiaceae bacterium]